MKRVLLWLLILTLLGWTGYKGGVWWLADQRISGARQALNDYGALQRGALHSSVSGHVLIRNSQWQDFRLTQPLTVGVAKLAAASPLSLLTLLYKPVAEIPWTLDLKQLTLTLDATMFRNWVTALGTNSDGEAALFALSCAPDLRQRLGSGDLLRMGIARVTGDARLSQNREGFFAEFSTDNLGSVELDWPGAWVDWSAPQEALKRQPLQITLRDGGVMRQISGWCAREAGLTPEQWAGNSVAVLRQGLLARGWQASSQLLALYRQWLLEGGELRATLSLSQPALGLPVYTADIDEPERIGAPVLYNSAQVPGVYLQADSAIAEMSVAPPQAGLSLEGLAAEGWVSQPLALMEQWLGQKVRVTLSNNNRVAGRLVRVSEGEVEVARLMAGGEVAYPMQRKMVTGFEIWRRNRPQNSINN